MGIKLRLAAIILAMLALTGCAGSAAAEMPVMPADTTGETYVPRRGDAVYVSITAEAAKALMDSEENYMVLDVRTPEEYKEGHIAGAVLIPYDEIKDRADEVLPDKDMLILVYCRSGRRSKIAAQALAELGYTNVKEFGGIIDWPYEIIKD